MARIRTIKPEFFTSEDIVALSPLARLLYIAVWCESDREGRLSWKPRTFKMRYFPADDCDIEKLCAELVSAGLVVLYGDQLAHVPTFSDHQHVNPREASSTLPDPCASVTRGRRVSKRANTVKTRVPHAQGGREGKEGVDDASASPDGQAATPKFLIPLCDGTDHPVTEAMVAEWAAAYPAVDVQQELREMRVWCLAKPERRKTPRGANTFIVGWLGRAQDKGPSRQHGVNGSAKDDPFAGAH